MSNLGELQYCLRVEFERNREARSITMNQRSYIEEVLKRFNQEECKSVGFLFDVNSKLLNFSDDEFENRQKENGRCFIGGGGRISHVCNCGHGGRYAFATSTVSQIDDDFTE